jgi:hypothetical protein
VNEENKLWVFESKVLRRILDLRANWKGRELHNENLNYELITEVALCW